jgi:DNA-binding IclR family transcriptional regulator
VTRPALAATRAIHVIDLLAAHPTERFTLAEIVRRTEINPASAHAIVAALVRGGMLQRHPTQKTFCLGPALVASGIAALELLPALRDGQHELERLSDELQLEVVLTAPTDDEIVVVGRAARAAEFGSVMHVGQKLPLRPPIGTVFLAWSEPSTITGWLARARPKLTKDEAGEQRRALDAVRSRGYSVGLESPAREGFGRVVATGGHAGAVDELLDDLAHTTYHLPMIEEGRIYNVSSIAAPVFDGSGKVVAAFTLSGMSPGMAARDIVRIAERLRGAALMVTKRTRGVVPAEARARA